MMHLRIRFAGAILAACLAPSTAAFAQATAQPRAAATAHERLAREIYAELIGINTVDSVGSTTRAARAMERRFQTMSTGATDGRFLRAAGIPTYGVSGIFSLPGENASHARDEKLRTTSFHEGLEFSDKLVRRVSNR